MSWSWKSTFVKLLAWYLRPLLGTIAIDNQDLDRVKLKSFWHHIWYLTQEPSIFDGTIYDNLVYSYRKSYASKKTEQSVLGFLDMHSKKNMPDDIADRLKQAITLAKCEFVYDLPKWLDTEIWERGVRLSWWQRQRLAIAKIFLKDPEIIILDEPTSALDSFHEEEITQAMHNLFAWRTVLIIAHRLQTVKNADEIIVLWQNDDWFATVIERWTHTELIAKQWYYFSMLELQTGF